MHTEASAWLHGKETDQWQESAVGKRDASQVRESIAKQVENRNCWLAYSDDQLAGTVTIDGFADPEFWNESDSPSDAVYVHRMIVRRSFAGRGIGKTLLLLAEAIARHLGRSWVRLDAWSTNEALHSYYRSVGFEHVRTLRYAHRGSGALFQRRVRALEEIPEHWRAGRLPDRV
jgi:ribosomal protein S18 acetylase RimI-like enzyme